MTGSKSASELPEELERRPGWRARIAGLVAGLLTALVLWQAGAPARQPLFDVYERILPPPPGSDQVVVVVIDTPSVEAIGGWPWSRYMMARLSEEIVARKPRAIGFDFLFPEPDPQTPSHFVGLYRELSRAAATEVAGLPSMDEVFAQVIGGPNAHVVLARYGIDQASYDTPEKKAQAEALFPPEARFVGPQPKAIPAYPTVGGNISTLDDVAVGHGLANGPPDRDGILRRVPLLGRAGDQLTPSLALELVRVAEGAETVTLVGDKERLEAVKVGRHRVPVDAGGRVMLRFTAGPKDADGDRVAPYRQISAVNLMRKGLPAEVIEGKIVLVGLAAAGTVDVVNTARDGRTFGVFVQAQAVDAILSGRGLRAPLWASLVEWQGGLLLMALAWFGVQRAPLKVVAATATVAAVLAFGASVLAFQQGVLLNPIPILAPGVAATVIMLGFYFVESRQAQERLKTALEAERLSAARVAGELAAASEIQAGMLIPRDVLARITPRAEIDAVLQPARSVGGDLYDAFLIDERRLCFLLGDVTGKGAPAALFMALSKALSHSILNRPNVDLGAGVGEINEELSRDNGQAMAVSLLAGVLNLEDGRLDMVCAGHENPLKILPDGRVEELKLDGGPPLCVADGFPYPVETFRLEPGETLVLLTDGVTEAHDPHDGLFDREGVLKALAGAAGLPPREVVDRLVAAVRAFEAGSEPSDDLTILALRLSAP